MNKKSNSKLYKEDNFINFAVSLLISCIFFIMYINTSEPPFFVGGRDIETNSTTTYTTVELVSKFIKNKNDDKKKDITEEDIMLLYDKILDKEKFLEELTNIGTGSNFLQQNINTIYNVLTKISNNDLEYVFQSLQILLPADKVNEIIFTKLTLNNNAKRAISKTFDIKVLFNYFNLSDLRKNFRIELSEIKNNDLYNDPKEVYNAGYNKLQEYIDYNNNYNDNKFTLLQLLQASFSIKELYEKGFTNAKDYTDIYQDTSQRHLIHLKTLSEIFTSAEIYEASKNKIKVEELVKYNIPLEWFIKSSNDNHDVAYKLNDIMDNFKDKEFSEHIKNRKKIFGIF